MCVSVCVCARANPVPKDVGGIGAKKSEGRTSCSEKQRGAVDILEGTAQQRPVQFVVTWIGDAQSTYLAKPKAGKSII